jgi:beta-1,2-mannobiose phosphorylase / 1,2-beta-oligomannan phosphorylase
MSDFKLKRLGMIMEPRPDDPNEVEGVLSPAAVRGHDGQDGQLFLFPRLVARGNYSRIGIARVLYHCAADASQCRAIQ